MNTLTGKKIIKGLLSMPVISRIINSTFVLLVLLSCDNFASDTKYAVKDIPKGLAEKVSAVIRLDATEFNVEDNESAVLKGTYVVTIFNKDEKDYGVLNLTYDKSIKIEEIEGYIYNAEGEEVYELEKSDIVDYSSYKDYNLYDDNRMRIANLSYNTYPYTVEFNYEMSYDGFINWPEWFSRGSVNPVEKAELKVIVPAGQQLRYWCNRDSLKPTITNNGDEQEYFWQWNNLPALPKEATDNWMMDLADVVLIAPSEFNIEGTSGNMSSWKDFGMWAYNIYSGKRKLPDDAISKVKEISQNAHNRNEIISGLYKYMQEKCRYVSIQLGIGSWQPFDASYVHTKGYGDCKALSNYMVALLEQAGIKSYPVLINSGTYRLPFIEEFSSNQFNHVVVCVPGDKDTTWLECTSSDILPGQIGWENENRKALMITPEGGVVVESPRSVPGENFMTKSIMVNLGVSNTTVNVHSSYGGNQMLYLKGISLKSSDDKEKWIKSSYEAPSVKLNDYKFTGVDETGKSMSLDYSLSIQQYASVTGNRLFFSPNLTERVDEIPGKIDKRVSPVMFAYPFKDVDSVYYIIPEGFTVESLPEETHLQSSFAEYFNKITADESGKLIYTRVFELKTYSVPAESYEEYRKFYSDIAKAERKKVILVKK